MTRPQTNSVIYFLSCPELALVSLTTTRMSLLANRITLLKQKKTTVIKMPEILKKLGVTNHEFKEYPLFLLSENFSNY